MGTDPSTPEPALHVGRVDHDEHLNLIEVEGALAEATGTRWRALLRGLIAEHAKGLVVDLRGCRAIDDHCLGALRATGATMKAGGGSGVALVTWPGSALSEDLRPFVGGDLPSYESARAALLALGNPV